MNNQKMMLVILSGGALFAMGTALILEQLAGPKKGKGHDTPAVETVEILRAAKDLNTGDTLATGSTVWTTWPKSAVFEGAVVRTDKQKPEEALTGRLKRPLSKGEPVLTSALIDDTKSNFLAASLSKGMRAVAVSVNVQTSVGGFVAPGDAVDVIMTYDVKLPMDDAVQTAAIPVVTRSAAETILENIKVLAIDQDTGKQAEAKPARSVTLAVTTKGAEILALASTMGTLSLSLRGIGDTSTRDSQNKDEPATTTDLRMSRVMHEIMKGENKTGSLNQVVRLYQGSNVQNVEVRPYYVTQ